MNNDNQSLSLKEKLKHLDAIGTAVFLGSIVSLLLVLQWGGQSIAWNSATSIGLFVCFGVCGLIFIALQWYLGEYATIPFRVIKIRSIYMGALVLFTLGISSIVVCSLFRLVHILSNCNSMPTTFQFSSSLPKVSQQRRLVFG